VAVVPGQKLLREERYQRKDIDNRRLGPLLSAKLPASRRTPAGKNGVSLLKDRGSCEKWRRQREEKKGSSSHVRASRARTSEEQRALRDKERTASRPHQTRGGESSRAFRVDGSFPAGVSSSGKEEKREIKSQRRKASRGESVRQKSSAKEIKCECRESRGREL